MTLTVSRCPACDHQVVDTAAFCSTCGAPQFEGPPSTALGLPSDIVPFPVPTQVSGHEILSSLTAPARPAQPAAASRPGHERLSGAAVTLFAILVVLVLALTAGGLRVAGIGTGTSPAQRDAAALARLQARLKPQLSELMAARSRFFTAERKYLPAMKQTRAALKSYTKKTAKVEAETKQIDAAASLTSCRTYSYVTCPAPRYPASPDAPDLSKQIGQLRSAARSMTALHAELVGAQPIAPLEPAYALLLSAVDTLGANAKENASILNTAVSAPNAKGGVGYIDKARLKALNGNDALASVRRLNRSLVTVLAHAQLPVAGYDLPGGRDTDPDDHSLTL